VRDNIAISSRAQAFRAPSLDWYLAAMSVGHRGMSALCQKRKSLALLNHLVGSKQQRLGHGEAKYFGSLEIKNQLDFCRLLNREISRFCPFQYLVGVDRGAAEKIRQVLPVSHQEAIVTASPLMAKAGNLCATAAAPTRARSLSIIVYTGGIATPSA